MLDPCDDDPTISLWGVTIMTAILKRGASLVTDFIECVRFISPSLPPCRR